MDCIRLHASISTVLHDRIGNGQITQGLHQDEGYFCIGWLRLIPRFAAYFISEECVPLLTALREGLALAQVMKPSELALYVGAALRISTDFQCKDASLAEN